MGFTTEGPLLWPIPPDWTDGVYESLEWLTEVQRARTGRQLKRQLRQYPRRTLEFSVIADQQARRVLDALLNDRGGRYWVVPLWHEVQCLGGGLSSGSNFVTCQTEGFEFVVGTRIALYLSLTEWWLGEIVAIESDRLILDQSLDRDWPIGTRLYPVRSAHLLEQPEETGWTDAAGTRSVQFLLDEYSDQTAVWPATTYRGLPVLELAQDWSDDIRSSFARDLEDVDASTGVIRRFDRSGRAFRHTEMPLIVGSRVEYSTLRSMLYALRGRMRTFFLPTWNTDLVLAAVVGAADPHISVQWAGYSLFGRQQVSWRDIRIELWAGARFYRRILGSFDNGSTERLTLDNALGQAITPDQVRRISFMVVSELASDTVELEHVTDAEGVTRLSLSIKGAADVL